MRISGFAPAYAGDTARISVTIHVAFSGGDVFCFSRLEASISNSVGAV